MNLWHDHSPSGRRHVAEPHYLRRLAQVGSVILAIGTFGVVVWREQVVANRGALLSGPIGPGATPAEAVEESAGPNADRDVGDSDALELSPEVRDSLRQIPTAERSAREQLELVVAPAWEVMPLPPLPSLAEAVAVPSETYFSSSKSSLLSSAILAEIPSGSSKDKPNRDDEPGEVAAEDLDAAGTASTERGP